MMDVPKIVLGRLRKAANPGDHPDADLLTAFAEQALAKRERLHVIEHLSQCSECREIVSVAQPEIREPQAEMSFRKPFSLRSPILRWGALAVCVVVVGATVTTRHLSQKRAETFAAKAPISGDALPQTFDLRTDELAAKLEPQLPKRELALPRRFAKQNTRGAAVDSKGLAVAAEKARTVKKESSSSAEMVAPAPSPTLLSKTADQEQQNKIARNELPAEASKSGNGAAMSETVMVEAGAAAVEVADATPGKAKEAKDSRMKAPAAGAGIGGNVAPLVANKMAGSRDEFNLPVNLIPRWNLSPQGRLQRSFDGGKSWETIPLSDKTVFRAVAVVGPEIWVGGDAGSLYRSPDSGQHWTQVRPTLNGESLTADIIGIEFTDSHRGKLTTSDHENWITSDAGQTWSRNK
ncbi:MAG TPA: YCF48-related protein [Terriglobales bacterium]|nr:YCF48-related protein [Terriglobales bacterium]